MYLSKDVKSHLEACVCRKQMNKQVFYVCVILHVGDLVLVFNIKRVESEHM